MGGCWYLSQLSVDEYSITATPQISSVSSTIRIEALTFDYSKVSRESLNQSTDIKYSAHGSKNQNLYINLRSHDGTVFVCACVRSCVRSCSIYFALASFYVDCPHKRIIYNESVYRQE